MTDPQSAPYEGRYPFMASRQGVWREICRYVRRDAPDAKTVLELGAGYCDFINSFEAPRKLAFDLNPEMRAFAGPDVDLRIGDAVLLPGIEDATIDLVFASNFLEHLTAEQLGQLLPRVKAVLRPGGKLALLQPNYRRCGARYFDDDTHVTVFSDDNLAQLLLDYGFRMKKIVPGLLPFSMKSRLPKWPALVRLYLESPIKPNGAQMYLVAERR